MMFFSAHSAKAISTFITFFLALLFNVDSMAFQTSMGSTTTAVYTSKEYTSEYKVTEQSATYPSPIHTVKNITSQPDFHQNTTTGKEQTTLPRPTGLHSVLPLITESQSTKGFLVMRRSSYIDHQGKFRCTLHLAGHPASKTRGMSSANGSRQISVSDCHKDLLSTLSLDPEPYYNKGNKYYALAIPLDNRIEVYFLNADHLYFYPGSDDNRYTLPFRGVQKVQFYPSGHVLVAGSTYFWKVRIYDIAKAFNQRTVPGLLYNVYDINNAPDLQDYNSQGYAHYLYNPRATDFTTLGIIRNAIHYVPPGMAPIGMDFPVLPVDNWVIDSIDIIRNEPDNIYKNTYPELIIMNHRILRTEAEGGPLIMSNVLRSSDANNAFNTLLLSASLCRQTFSTRSISPRPEVSIAFTQFPIVEQEDGYRCDYSKYTLTLWDSTGRLTADVPAFETESLAPATLLPLNTQPAGHYVYTIEDDKVNLIKFRIGDRNSPTFPVLKALIPDSGYEIPVTGVQKIWFTYDPDHILLLVGEREPLIQLWKIRSNDEGGSQLMAEHTLAPNCKPIQAEVTKDHQLLINFNPGCESSPFILKFASYLPGINTLTRPQAFATTQMTLPKPMNQLTLCACSDTSTPSTNTPPNRGDTTTNSANIGNGAEAHYGKGSAFLILLAALETLLLSY